MNNFYIFRADSINNEKSFTTTIVFCNSITVNKNSLIEEIKLFFETNSQTDKIFVIGGEYLENDLRTNFIEKFDETFIGIPRREDTSLIENLHLFVFNINGNLKNIHNQFSLTNEFQKKIINDGLQNIFISRGGLVETEGTHHYVFPSGKHCNKFLRTGNILIYSSEIYFIAYSLLKYLDIEKHTNIYCDTSSIISVALALNELVNRFNKKPVNLIIESFSSYEGLYKNNNNYKNNSLLLISASTSGNILNYITKNHVQISRNNIVVLYFLDINNCITDVQESVLCDLTYHNTKNINGILPYESYLNKNCSLCKKGSFPVEVSGDVFLLERPRINSIMINKEDADKKLSDFINEFKTNEIGIFKVNYKENDASKKYEIYIDYSEIIKGLNNNKYKNYKTKLDSYINQFVPSNTKFIVYLNDNSSKELANYIFDKIKSNYKKKKLPDLIAQKDSLKEKIDNKDISGSVLVVGSCISNGKNLLYLSRALRNFDSLRVVYFTGITRMNNEKILKQLKSNLKQGTYGPESSTFINVENVYCLNKSMQTSWIVELDFINKILDFLKYKPVYFKETINFFEERKKNILNSSNDTTKGLVNDIFYPNVTNLLEGLKIRKNFAFWNFNDYLGKVSQSDIYFTISNVINSLRNTDKIERALKQSSFVRNLISPANFNRYNDGIIQASILRCANPEELSYSIDYELSLEMKNILETLIIFHKEEQGEALLEFLYAIAIEKLSLKEEHLEEIINLLESKCDELIIKAITQYIKNSSEERKTKH
jgi:hypothetical protein